MGPPCGNRPSSDDFDRRTPGWVSVGCGASDGGSPGSHVSGFAAFIRTHAGVRGASSHCTRWRSMVLSELAIPEPCVIADPLSCGHDGCALEHVARQHNVPLSTRRTRVVFDLASQIHASCGQFVDILRDGLYDSAVRDACPSRWLRPTRGSNAHRFRLGSS